MSTHNARRTPAGYAVVEVEQGAAFEHNGVDNRSSFLSRVRSLKLNGWEIALWVVAVVLIVASIQMSVYATQHLYMGSYTSECDSDGVCTSPSSVVYLQAAMSLSPAGFAAGLISAIAAIAVRALNSAAQRRGTTEAAASTQGTSNLANSAPTTSGATPEPLWYIGMASDPAAQSHRTAAPAPPAPPAPTYPAPPAGAASALVNHASFARPSSAPPAEPDLSVFQRPSD